MRLGAESAESAIAEIVTYHGWGFDLTCWADWVDHWSSRGHRVRCFNRGYWNSSCDPQFSEHPASQLRILLIHSFGLHFCPLEMLRAADQIIIFNSFLCFHPKSPRLQRRSQRTVDRMSDRLKTLPQEVLHKFWVNCYAPMEYPSPALRPSMVPSQTKKTLESPSLNLCLDNRSERNQPLLEQDLEALNHTAMTAKSEKIIAIRQTPSVTVIHGEADQIVSVSQGATLADAVSAEWITVPNIGHALPFSHPALCWSLAPFSGL